jgi:hypothetical protein
MSISQLQPLLLHFEGDKFKNHQIDLADTYKALKGLEGLYQLCFGYSELTDKIKLKIILDHNSIKEGSVYLQPVIQVWDVIQQTALPWVENLGSAFEEHKETINIFTNCIKLFIKIKTEKKKLDNEAIVNYLLSEIAILKTSNEEQRKIILNLTQKLNNSKIATKATSELLTPIKSDTSASLTLEGECSPPLKVENSQISIFDLDDENTQVQNLQRLVFLKGSVIAKSKKSIITHLETSDGNRFHAKIKDEALVLRWSETSFRFDQSLKVDLIEHSTIKEFSNIERHYILTNFELINRGEVHQLSLL